MSEEKQMYNTKKPNASNCKGIVLRRTFLQQVLGSAALGFTAFGPRVPALQESDESRMLS